jgi:hypothetical protein
VSTIISIGRSHPIDEEDNMISQERANPPADGPQPVSVEERCPTGTQGLEGQSEMPFDYIDEALEETMIACDPPALTPRTTVGPPDRGATPVGLDRSSMSS